MYWWSESSPGIFFNENTWGIGAVTVDQVRPEQEHALEYWAQFVQAVAYEGNGQTHDTATAVVIRLPGLIVLVREAVIVIVEAGSATISGKKLSCTLKLAVLTCVYPWDRFTILTQSFLAWVRGAGPSRVPVTARAQLSAWLCKQLKLRLGYKKQAGT